MQPNRDAMVAALMRRGGNAMPMQGGMHAGAAMPMPTINGNLPTPPVQRPMMGGMMHGMMNGTQGGGIGPAYPPDQPPAQANYGAQFGIPPALGNFVHRMAMNGLPQAQPGGPQTPEELQNLLNMIQQRSGGGMPVG